MLNTARNRVLADIIFSYASLACSNGKTSIIGRTSVSTLNRTAASISFDRPVNEPRTVWGPFRKSMADSSKRSPEPATIMSSPSFPNPSINVEMTFAFGAVARITFAPPSACKALAGSSFSESI